MGDTISERRAKVLELVKAIRTLPTLPAMLARMNTVIQNPDATAKDVADVISTDPAVTAGILRIVNSPFYGLPNRIATVTHAIMILGFNTVKAIATSSSLVNTFGDRPKTGGFVREQFWMHSIACGAACRTLARQIGDIPMQEDYFIAGLLHDVGKIVLDQCFSKEFLKVQEDVQKRRVAIREAEEALLGVNHADIGGVLFDSWKLAPGIVQAVACHHMPGLAGEQIRAASVVHMGDILARALMVGSGGDDTIPTIDKAAWDNLGLQKEQLPRLLADVDAEIQRASVFMELMK